MSDGHGDNGSIFHIFPEEIERVSLSFLGGILLQCIARVSPERVRESEEL